MKADRHRHRPLAGPQAVALIFDKPTLRTQLSFSVGVAELGGQPLVVDGRLAGIGERESIADTTRVLARQVAAIVWRTYGQDRIEDDGRAQHACPVVNALTDAFHPCQILADLQTVREHRGALAGLIAHLRSATRANNMAHSYLLGGAAAGMHVRIAGPAGYQPDPQIVDAARRSPRAPAARSPSPTDPAAAFDGADVVATDTWVSMGQEDGRPSREAPFRPYAVDRRRRWPGPRTTRSCCTACPPTAARRSRPRSSTARRASSGTRPRTACTRRRRC